MGVVAFFYDMREGLFPVISPTAFLALLRAFLWHLGEIGRVTSLAEMFCNH